MSPNLKQMKLINLLRNESLKLQLAFLTANMSEITINGNGTSSITKPKERISSPVYSCFHFIFPQTYNENDKFLIYEK